MSFWQSKTKIRRVDKLFSDYIRNRDNWHCVYRFQCLGVIDYRDNPGGLTNSHFQKRRHESTRFEPDNCDSACRTCHGWVEDKSEGKKALEAWKKKQLGPKRYASLLVQAQTYQHKDDKLNLLKIKLLLKEQARDKLKLLNIKV